MSARTPNRRGVLAGLAAAPFAAVSAQSADNPRISVTSADSSADDAFRRWLAGVQEYNANPGDDDDLAYGERLLDEPEAALRELPPSIMAAAAFALAEISHTGPDSEAIGDYPPDQMPLLRVLTCLRPFLTGAVGDVARDLLDTADRPYGECLLSRCIRGQPLPADRGATT